MERILRLPAVCVARGRGRSANYGDIKNGLFTEPVPLAERAVGWPEYEVAAINAARIAGLSADDIRELVQLLHLARKAEIGRPEWIEKWISAKVRVAEKAAVQ
jgi:prophage regulatory protein